MCEISVIVPVYNVENHLSACLDSILNQSFRGIEVICVNDGSTDNSLSILEGYAKKDKRIKIITQENQGLGASRNRGLNESKGKYVYFIDSDDFIDLNTLEKLHNNAVENSSDMVMFKYQTFGGNNKQTGFKIDRNFGDIDYSTLKFTYSDVKNHVLNSEYSACTKLYKKKFLDSYDDFYFPEGVLYEDIPFHVKAMLRASSISFVPEELYYYRVNPISISNSNTSPFDIFKIIDMVESFLKQENYYEEFEIEFFKFKVAQILRYLFLTNSIDYFNRAKNEFKKMEIKNESLIKKDWISAFKLIISSDDYDEFVSAYFNNRISELTELNEKLKQENKRLNVENQKILSSTSWRLTKSLRNLRKFH